MALINDKTRKVDIPHESGEWMEVKKLSWRQLEVARDIMTDNTVAKFRKMGGEMVKAFTNEKARQEADPRTQYDRGFVLEAGISRWSYDAEVTKANIEKLDEETAKWAFEEILNLNNPLSEEERKNA